MKKAILVILALGWAVAPAWTQDEGETYRYGRIRWVEPGVTLQRAAETAAEEADVNSPFLPGDRLFTDAGGRAEIQFADGSIVRLDVRGKLDYASQSSDAAAPEAALQLWSGSLFLHTAPGSGNQFFVDAAAALVSVPPRSIVRVDLRAGEVRVSVYEGSAELESNAQRQRVDAGERSQARYAEGPGPAQPFSYADLDAFALWDRDRQEEVRWAANQQYLPEEVAPYAPDLVDHGSWYYEADDGFVWRPVVSIDWRPYWHGHWSWTLFGWTWIPDEPWGWVVCHYGRWGHSARLGWYWIPRPRFSPAWVSWAFGSGHVGWCPLDRHNRPVERAFGGRHGGRVVRRGERGTGDDHGGPWTFVRRADWSARDLGRRGFAGRDPRAHGLALSESPRLRPSHDLARLERGGTTRVMPTNRERSARFGSTRVIRRGDFSSAVREGAAERRQPGRERRVSPPSRGQDPPERASIRRYGAGGGVVERGERQRDAAQPAQRDRIRERRETPRPFFTPPQERRQERPAQSRWNSGRQDGRSYTAPFGNRPTQQDRSDLNRERRETLRSFFAPLQERRQERPAQPQWDSGRQFQTGRQSETGRQRENAERRSPSPERREAAPRSAPRERGDGGGSARRRR